MERPDTDQMGFLFNAYSKFTAFTFTVFTTMSQQNGFSVL